MLKVSPDWGHSSRPSFEQEIFYRLGCYSDPPCRILNSLIRRKNAHLKFFFITHSPSLSLKFISIFVIHSLFRRIVVYLYNFVLSTDFPCRVFSRGAFLTPFIEIFQDSAIKVEWRSIWAIPYVTDCVIGELEKMGQKFKIALKILKDPRFQRLSCHHKGIYADDCLVQRVTQVGQIHLAFGKWHQVCYRALTYHTEKKRVDLDSRILIVNERKTLEIY